MKTRIAALVLLSATAGSAFAHGGDAIAGFAVGTIVGNVIASQPRASVSVQYGGYPAPAVVYSPAPVVGYTPPPVIGYAPPPAVIGYAPPPPAMVYPAPRVVYEAPAYGYRWRGHHHHHRDFDGDGRWGRGRW